MNKLMVDGGKAGERMVKMGTGEWEVQLPIMK